MVVGIKVICEDLEILQCSFCFFTIETGYRHAGVSQDEIAGLRVDILYADGFMYTAEIDCRHTQGTGSIYIENLSGNS